MNRNNDEPNPLISVCKCSGSVKLVHLNCLRSWLDSKKETRVTDSTSSYQWTIIRCELCHHPYPNTVTVPVHLNLLPKKANEFEVSNFFN